MKSLVESLFDRDLAEKPLPTFGDHYRVKGAYMIDDEYQNGGESYKTSKDDYAWLMGTIKLNLLKKVFRTPVKIDNKNARDNQGFIAGWPAKKDFCDDLGYLIDAINTIPYVGKENDDYPYIGVRHNDVVNTLAPYFKNMKGDNRYGRGGNYYFARPSSWSHAKSSWVDKITFTIQRKDMTCTIVFEEI